ncbi:MAG: DoxX family protein [Rhodoglobus sp.]
MPLIEVLQLILRVALAAVFFFMGITHFLPAAGRTMAAMIPPALTRQGWPSAKAWVRVTGVCEIAGAIGLLVPATRLAAGIALVVFLIAVFPANAVAASNPAKFGRAAIPFWPRLGAQLALIAACALAAI